VSPRYEHEPAATAEVAAGFALPGASGAVALRAGNICGFLLGAPKASPVWGSNIWVDATGQAAADPELVRDMYGLAAARWVGESRRAHYVLVPAGDEDLLRASCPGSTASPPSSRPTRCQAMRSAVIAWTAQAGYRCVVTDWRVTNPLSSRTWPRLGFAESFLRLHRLVGY
jgi:hypothetical protein